MPSAKYPDHEVPQVDDFAALLKEVLDHAQAIKPAASIEPPLTEADFSEFLARVPTIFFDKTRQWAIVETAARNVFSSLVVSINLPNICRSSWSLILSRPRLRSIHPSSYRSGTSSIS